MNEAFHFSVSLSYLFFLSLHLVQVFFAFLSFHATFFTLLLFQLYHKARHHVQSAKQLFALASEQSTLKPSPLRMKKIYVLGGLEVRDSTASLTCFLACLLASLLAYLLWFTNCVQRFRYAYCCSCLDRGISRVQEVCR
jgi:hypothetical protein